ncbi:gene transfer agent family protein [Rhodobacter sp. KR11]|uniref:gene transfer agent family protein n=1 Tax=Rhodobacter sp. KR11 TaxID=2974588 RepID=UPI002223D033|nr:gene transfer agent family protein [Rhodobacter sp. KR11]MCW1919977.1 gene transfer agent family protein [Rhodobacter sp. KR11]
MSDRITHVTFFGDATHNFTLTDPMIAELERLTATGIGALYFRVINMQFNADTLGEIIRLGLIGGGTDPETAKRLVDTYARNRPLAEVFPLALDVLDARWTGKPQEAAA